MRFLTLLCCFLIASVSMAKDFKVGTVDLQKLFKEYPGTKEANKKFTAMATKKQQEFTDALEEWKDLEKELKNSSSVLSTKQRKQKEKEYMTKGQALQQQQEQLRTELASKEQEMSAALFEKIKVIIAAVAKNAGVDLVVESDKTVFVKDPIDLTNDVLKSYPKSDSSKDDK